MLISSWNTPYNPETKVKLKLDITQTEKYLETLSKSGPEKLTLTVFNIRLMALVLKRYPELCGYFKFGEVS